MKNIFLFLIIFSIISFIFLLLYFRDSYLYDGSIHLGIFSLAMYLLWKNDLKTTLHDLGFPGSIKNALVYSVAGLGAIFILLFILGILSLTLGFNDQNKISEKIADLPIYILVFAIFFAPLSEELFFRAFLVPRIGVLFSAFVFGLVHLAYGSVIEVVGVTLVGIILALVFKTSKSITPCILTHMIYNLLSIIAMRLLM